MINDFQHRGRDLCGMIYDMEIQGVIGMNL